MIEKLAGIIAGPRTRWITLVAWIIIAALLSLFLPAVGDKEESNAPNLNSDSPSVVAERLIKDKFPSSSGIPALVVWHREGGLSDEDFALIQQTTQALIENPLKEQGEVVPLHQMPIPALQKFASEDGTTLVQPISFGEQTETEVLKANIEAIKGIINEASGKEPFATAVDDKEELSVRVSGPVGISVDATDLFKGADISLLIATVLIVLILLLLIYRSPILAIIPLIGVGFAYAVTSPLLGWMAGEGWITVDAQAISIMTVLLFGAGTDYCLFFISHFRLELTRESDKMVALKRSFKDASGAIAMSGFTVVLSLLALLAAKYGAYDRFAVPFSLSILIMGIASLTLVPALLAIIGRVSFFPFIPRTEFMEQVRAGKKGKPYRKPNPEKKLGSKIGNLVIAKPWMVVISSVVVLGILASFSSQIKFTYDLLSSFPKDMPSREGFELISNSFTPGDLAPITVVAQTDGSAPDLAGKLAAVPLVDHVQEPQPSVDDPNLLSYKVILNTNPYSSAAMGTIPLLHEAAEAALAGANVAEAGKKVWVGGQTATQYDSKVLTDRDNRVIIPLVTLLIMILLLVYLRSITATLYLIGTVLLSFAAALGLGWVILHYFMGVDAIQGAIPLYAFVFLIALGEDYNIFMISSIWQKRKKMPLKQAIKEGVSETGGVITSAGLILAATFAVLATLPIQVLVQFGLITAIGVLMDTFIVRPFLVPAITTLLGKKAFWPSKVELVEESKKSFQG
ncbi:MMPL family transporter [Paenibacillus sp. PL91]|uniref:MMPL family transporter n=1 Tax=Paenibacillus sp. PL91 TaxID=2729538 RepID=UPI00145CF3DF|nr:MMPL family transporter [Paenibacillus sp. PL91]MBC9199412.1 MMPL family transporter [Paenibacillus sp. PL91]